MLSNKSYLIRAFYDWIIDSACTPYIAINASYERCNVPKEYVENGEITLNISPTAIRDFKISKEVVEFQASFSGVVHIISAPIKAVLAIYAQENQQGMFFDYEEDENIGDLGDGVKEFYPTSILDEQTVAAVQKSKSHLKLVE